MFPRRTISSKPFKVLPNYLKKSVSLIFNRFGITKQLKTKSCTNTIGNKRLLVKSACKLHIYQLFPTRGQLIRVRDVFLTINEMRKPNRDQNR